MVTDPAVAFIWGMVVGALLLALAQIGRGYRP